MMIERIEEFGKSIERDQRKERKSYTGEREREREREK